MASKSRGLLQAKTPSPAKNSLGLTHLIQSSQDLYYNIQCIREIIRISKILLL